MYLFLLIVFITSYIISIKTKDHEKSRLINELLAIIILFLITLIIGLRYGVGKDYFNYKTYFDNFYEDFYYEPFYSNLVYIVKVNLGEFYYITLIMIFITNLFVYLGLKKRNINGKYLILSLAIYFTSSVLVFANGMRQGVAVALFFYASSFIKERDFKNYLMFSLLAVGFHYSALVLLPLYFFDKVSFSKKSYLLSLIIAYFAVFINVTKTLLLFLIKLAPKYNKYLEQDFIFSDNINILSLGVLLNVILIVLLVLFNDRSNQTKSYSLDENFYLIGILLTILSLSSFMFGRVGMYFVMFGASAIPSLIKTINRKQLRSFAILMTIIVTMILFTKLTIISPEDNHLEYKSIYSQR